MRYSAPVDVTGIDLTTGPVEVVDGYVEVPDILTMGDAVGLFANGFLPDSASAPVEGEASTPTPPAPPSEPETPAEPAPDAEPAA